MEYLNGMDNIVIIYFIPFKIFHLSSNLSQKVHLLGIRKTIEEYTSKGTKNTFGTLQNPNVPFGVFLV